MSYLSLSSYAAALRDIAALRYDSRRFCSFINIGRTHEGRAINGLRIYNGTSRTPRAALIIGGVHAREMIPPEAVLLFARSLCDAYATETGFSFGGRSYTSGVAKLLVEAMEIIIIPVVNPDGRAYVESTDVSWRKNRRPAVASSSCVGTDLNRNYDFLFNSGLGTSTSPCSYQVYRGPSAHSEQETRAIRDFLDANAHIRGLLDVHSYTGLILYPWGDDTNQSSDLAMNFQNPAFDGQRGTRTSAPDRTYKEYMRSRDWLWYRNTANTMRDGVFEVAGRNYTAQQSFDLYATSGTVKDYAYSRHITAAGSPKILSMTVEIGFYNDGQFRPAEPIAQTIRHEGATLITEFCIAIMCAGDAVLNTTAAASALGADLRDMRTKMADSSAGRRYVDWSTALAGEVIMRVANPSVAKQMAPLTKYFAKWWAAKDMKLGDDIAAQATEFLSSQRKGASKELLVALDAFTADIERMRGKPASAALRTIRAKAEKVVG